MILRRFATRLSELARAFIQKMASFVASPVMYGQYIEEFHASIYTLVPSLTVRPLHATFRPRPRRKPWTRLCPVGY